MPPPSGKPKLKSEPVRWPIELRYIHRLVYHSSVSAVDRKYLETPPEGYAPPPASESVCSLVVIKPITYSSHPAKGQYGLFAAKKIPARTRMCEAVSESRYCGA
jgi:hypothetical protein